MRSNLPVTVRLGIHRSNLAETNLEVRNYCCQILPVLDLTLTVVTLDLNFSTKDSLVCSGNLAELKGGDSGLLLEPPIVIRAAVRSLGEEHVWG